jgi:hypothetical protein
MKSFLVFMFAFLGCGSDVGQPCTGSGQGTCTSRNELCAPYSRTCCVNDGEDCWNTADCCRGYCFGKPLTCTTL